MSIVKIVNASSARVHVTCVDQMLPAGGFFAISEAELEKQSEILTCLASGILKKEPFEEESGDVSAETDAEEKTEESAEETPDVAEPETVEVNDVDSMEEAFGISFSDADKPEEGSDDKAYVKVKDDVAEVKPFKTQVGKEVVDSGNVVDGIEVLDTEKEKTVNVDGIDLIVDDSEEDEYGPEFIEHDSP